MFSVCLRPQLWKNVAPEPWNWASCLQRWERDKTRVEFAWTIPSVWLLILVESWPVSPMNTCIMKDGKTKHNKKWRKARGARKAALMSARQNQSRYEIRILEAVRTLGRLSCKR